MTEKAGKQSVIYRFGQFEIDAGEGFLRREGEVVPLTPKIFEMLLMLVKNNGRIISKDEIMETIWADSFVEETNLTSNISRLRKILHAGDEQFIETFPKRGYRFRADIETSDAEIVLNRRVTTRVIQVVEEYDEADELPEYAAALETLPNNLSLPTTAIIGREREISEIESFIRRSRLVTLTGIGGTGKTRLAQEIGCRMLSEFADGVFFVALAAVKNAELVLSEIAKIFGVKESGGKKLSAALKNFLREKSMLLVIDNFEQIISAAPILEELLADAPQIKMLITSRALLHLKPEREFIVPPLALPFDFGFGIWDLGLPVKNDQLQISNLKSKIEENESIKLFTERARAIKSNFSLTEDNAATVAEICVKLEGLPLAIELAAARIKILSPAQILERLENRLKMLTGGAKDLPARQQTMRGAIEWSYDLLDENDRILFERLAVFVGGFTIEAAESVVLCPLSFVEESANDKEQRTIDVLNGITSLVENSLLVQTETFGGESRFRFLEVVREYALEKLEAGGEAESIRKNHAAFFLKLAETAEPQILGKQGAKWLTLIEEEHNNFRTAFFWAAAIDAPTAVHLAGALRDFWVLRNQLTEGREWFKTALDRADDAPAAARFNLFVGLGQTAKFQGDYVAARKAFQEGLTTSRESGDLRQIAVANRGLAGAAKMQGDFTAARNFYEEALTVSRRIDEKFGIAVSLNSLGDLARIKGDFAAAHSFFDESLTICREIGNIQGIGCTLNNLGAIAFMLGDYETARSHFTEGLRTAQELGEKITLSYSLDGFAALAEKRGDAERALQLAGAAENLRESLGFETEPAERHFRDAYLAELRSLLPEEKFTATYREGCRMKIKKAVSLALGNGL